MSSLNQNLSPPTTDISDISTIDIHELGDIIPERN